MALYSNPFQGVQNLAEQLAAPGAAPGVAPGVAPRPPARVVPPPVPGLVLAFGALALREPEEPGGLRRNNAVLPAGVEPLPGNGALDMDLG